MNDRIPTETEPAIAPLLGDGMVLVTRPSLSPPFDNPVLVFGLAMAIFLIAPLLFKRIRLPGIIGIILIGAAVGPNGFAILERSETIELLGEVGLIYLMFIAGLEINLNQFLEYKDRSIVFGSVSFLLPQILGFVIALYVFELPIAAAFLFGAVVSSHTLLSYPVVSRLGLAKNEAMTATIGGTIITDTAALLVLAVVIASTEGDLDAAFWTEFAVGLTIFFVGVWLIIPRLGRWFFRFLDEESYFEFLFVMTVLFLCAFLAEMVGVEHIIGAFLAGLALNRLISETGTLMNRIEFVGNALFIPFFLLSIGMLVDVGILVGDPDTLLITAALTGIVLVAKPTAAWVTGQIYGYTRNEMLGMVGLSVGQAAAILAIVQIGFDAGVPGFDQNMINAAVLLILIFSVISPALVERAGSGLLREQEHGEYDPSDSPQRILVPVSRQSEHKESLLDLAFSIRDDRSEEPVHVLSVVQPKEDEPTEADVEDTESLQAEIESYGAGAEVPIDTHTRVSEDIASGVLTTTVEQRISTMVIGWDGAKSRAQRVFGHVIDQALNRVDRLTLVSRIREPLNTTNRILLILPPHIDHNDGFYEALHTIKRLAEQTGAPIHGLAVDGNPEQFEHISTRVEPEVPTEYEAVEDWKVLLSMLRDDVESGDLIVCMSARREDIGWHSELQTLPKSISTLTEGNFAIVYPAKGEHTDDRSFLRMS